MADLQQRRLTWCELHPGHFRGGVGDRLLHHRGGGAAAVTQPQMHHARFVYPEELKTVARVQAFRDFLVANAQRWNF